MGRWSKGIEYITKATCLNIDYLRKKGLIVEHKHLEGTITWSNGYNMKFTSHFTNDEKYIELEYSYSNKTISENHKYRITIVIVPSNLKNGFNWYFICPVSGTRAKALHMAYNSQKFIHREAYKNKGCTLYYPVQTSSKYEYHNDRY